jgi:mono/diheme cytochrome c family protein
VSPAPATVVGSLPQGAAEPATPAFKLKGDPTAGAKIFTSAGCVGCHTLAAAHATGTVGPNLDQAKPDYRLVTARVTNGKGVMPSFKGQLTDQQIADVAAFVVKATGGTPP